MDGELSLSFKHVCLRLINQAGSSIHRGINTTQIFWAAWHPELPVGAPVCYYAEKWEPEGILQLEVGVREGVLREGMLWAWSLIWKAEESKRVLGIIRSRVLATIVQVQLKNFLEMRHLWIKAGIRNWAPARGHVHQSARLTLGSPSVTLKRLSSPVCPALHLQMGVFTYHGTSGRCYHWQMPRCDHCGWWEKEELLSLRHTEPGAVPPLVKNLWEWELGWGGS